MKPWLAQLSLFFISTAIRADDIEIVPRLQAGADSPIASSVDTLPPLFSSDGAIVAVASKSTSLVFWDVQSGKLLRNYQFGENSDIYAIKSVSGKHFFLYGRTGALDQKKERRRIEVWDWNSLCKVRNIEIPRFPEGSFQDLAISKSERYVSFVIGTEVFVVNGSDGTEVCNVVVEYQPSRICFSNDEKSLVIGGSKNDSDSAGRISFLEIDTGELKQVKLKRQVTSLTPDMGSNSVYSTTSASDRIAVWDLTDMQTKSEIVMPAKNFLISEKGQWSLNRAGCLFAFGDDRVRLFQRTSNAADQLIEIPLDTESLLREPKFSFSQNADLMVVHGIAGNKKTCSLHIWSLKPAKQLEFPNTLSRQDQEDIERYLGSSGSIDMDYINTIGPSRYNAWKSDSANGCKFGKFLHGMGLQVGFGGVKNKTLATRLIAQAAEEGNALALVYLASIEKVPSKSFELFMKAADTDEPFAMEYLANIFRTDENGKKDMAKAIALSRKAASSSEPFAASMTSVGKMFLVGEGVEQSLLEAIQWFEKAAELNHPEGCVQIGKCFLAGEGVELNPKKAFEYFAKASRLGSRNGEMMLAFCLEEGLGCEQDLNGALLLYRMLDKLNVPTARACVVSVKMRLVPQPNSSGSNIASSDDNSLRLFYSVPASGHRFGPEAYDRIQNAQRAAFEAQRDYRAHVGGNLGALGIIPLHP